MLKDYFNAHRQSCLESARQCLIDNGIETDEVETVLQALCYILLNEEIQENEPSNAKVLPKTSSVNNSGYRLHLAGTTRQWVRKRIQVY